MGSVSYGIAHLPQTRSDGVAFGPPSHPALSMLGLLGLLFELALDGVAVLLRAGAGGLAFGLLGPGLTLRLGRLPGLLPLGHGLPGLGRGCSPWRPGGLCPPGRGPPEGV